MDDSESPKPAPDRIEEGGGGKREGVERPILAPSSFLNSGRSLPQSGIALLRVSTPDQVLGIDAQRAAISAFAAREGIQVTAWHVENGSGGLPLARRPVLQAAIADVLAHKASALLVGKRDRLARDPMVALLVERAIGPARILAADGHNADDPGGKLMRHILDGVAEFERAMISVRTKAALQALKDGGKVLGRRVGQVDTKPRRPRSDKGVSRENPSR